VAEAFDALLGDPARRALMGKASRARAEAEFAYDVLADRLGRSLGAIP
jgi:hypothetical protein